MSFPLSLLSGNAAALPPEGSGPVQVKPGAGDGSSRQGPQEQSFADVMVQAGRDTLEGDVATETAMVPDDQSPESAELATPQPDHDADPKRATTSEAASGRMQAGDRALDTAPMSIPVSSAPTDEDAAFVTDNVAAMESDIDLRSAVPLQQKNMSALSQGDPEAPKALADDAIGISAQNQANLGSPASAVRAVAGPSAPPEQVAKSPALAQALARKDSVLQQTEVRPGAGSGADATTRSSAPPIPSAGGNELMSRGDGHGTPRATEAKAAGAMPRDAAGLPLETQKSLSPVVPRSAISDDIASLNAPVIGADASAARSENKTNAPAPQMPIASNATALKQEALVRHAPIKELKDAGRSDPALPKDATSSQSGADVKHPAAAKAVPASATQIAITYNLSAPAGNAKLKTETGRAMPFETVSGSLPMELTGLQSSRMIDDSGSRIISFDARGYATRPDAMTNEMARRVAGQFAQTVSPGGEQTIELRLTPEELGAIKYRMVLTETGATIVVQADRGDTLDLVRRHLESLQREFLRAGFEDATFSFEHGASGDDTSDHQKADQSVPLPIELEDSAAVPQNHTILNLSARGLDIRL